MDFQTRFDQALSYHEFLDQYGTEEHRRRWQGVYEQVHLTSAQSALLESFVRRMHVLCLSGAWCGDCVQQCPIFHRFAEVSPTIDLRFLDRDEHPDLQELLSINAGHRVPVVVFLSDDGHEVSRYGDRTLSRYRHLARQQLGPACPTALGPVPDDLLAATTQDWLDQFERVQWLLRTSPRLRQRHGD